MKNQTIKSINKYEKKIKKNIPFNMKNNLESTINKAILNNKKIIEKSKKNNLFEEIFQYIPIKANEFIDIFNLRYISFEKRGYNKLINNEKNNFYLNYDDYDENSIILKYSRKNIITATTRAIIDGKNGIYSEFNFDNKIGFREIRNKNNINNNKIAEISRSSILPEFQGSGIEFKNLFKTIYYVGKILNVGDYITAIAKEDYKLYEKAGFKILKEDFGYSKIEKEVLYLSWEINNPNKFFKKIFLNDSNNQKKY